MTTPARAVVHPLAAASRAADRADGSAPAPGAAPPASGALSSKPAGEHGRSSRSAVPASGSLSSSPGSGPLSFIVVLDSYHDGSRPWTVVDVDRGLVVAVWVSRTAAEADAQFRNRKAA